MGEIRVLDHKADLKVSYCIPLWLRDQQIRVNTDRVKGRIKENYEKRPEAIAIVCYGPSLNETWEKIKDFKFVMTCSGAHSFLIQRGIIPTWHVEVDPREHKTKLVGEPHKDVEYLIASTCHPRYFQHLLDKVPEDHVKLWHVFDPNEDALRVLPPGEWALTGGCGAGLRALTIARFFGFTELHVFGMDGSEGTEDAPAKTGKHAGNHPNQAPSYSLCEFGGKKYRTNPAFLEAARQTWHELDQMPDVHATFYGEGLVQAMSREYVRKPGPVKPFISFIKPTLITDDYRALNVKLHEENLAFGVGGDKHAKTIIKLAQGLKTTSILDYGCGKGSLAKAIPWPIWEYDPAIPGKQEAPRPAELVVCTDVLEHVEPEKIKYVLLDLARCVLKIGFFVIHTGPSKKTLADGRNAHILQRDAKWWEAKLNKFFTVGKIFKIGLELFVIVSPRQAPSKKLPVKSKVKEKING